MTGWARIDRGTARASLAAALAIAVTGSATAAPASVSHTLPPGARVIATIRVPHASGSIGVGAGAVWAMKDDGSTLYRIDSRRSAVVARIALGTHKACPAFPQSCGEIAVGAATVWVAEPAANEVVRINPRTNTVVARVSVAKQPAGVAVSPGAVWVASLRGPSLTRIDPATNRVVTSIAVGTAGPCCGNHITVAWGAGAVWVTLEQAGAVARIEPATNAVSIVPVPWLRFGQPCGGLLATPAAVWAAGAHCPASTGSAVVIRIDPQSAKVVADVRGVQSPIGLALASGSLWVADLDAKSVVRVDPVSNRVTGRLSVGGVPIGLADGYGSLWLGDATGRVLRLGPDVG